MKTVSVAMKAHIAEDVSTLCTCWEITRRDGVILRFTDLDVDLVVDGHNFVAALGYTRSAMTMNQDFSIDNLQVAGIIDDDSLTDEDIRAGLFDGADLKMFMVNYKDLSMGIIKMRHGIFGDVVATPSGRFQTQMNGLGQELAHVIGDIYTGTCSVDLGSPECTKDLSLGAGLTISATVATVDPDNQNFTMTYDEPRAVDDWFSNGGVTWLTGDNSGRSIEVKNWTQSTSALKIFVPMPRTIQVGDTFTIYPGCDKLAKTCRDKFDNIINNRSFPFIPGLDRVLQAPTTLI